jgi:hypothetical protein
VSPSTGGHASQISCRITRDTRDTRDGPGIGAWLAWLARDPARLAASLEEFAGHPAYGLDQLRDDLERFAFLPGGSDGESLFGPPRLT